MTKELKKYVDDGVARLKKSGEWNQYPVEALTFAILMGMTAEECAGMYIESDMDADTIGEIEIVDDYLYQLKRKEA